MKNLKVKLFVILFLVLLCTVFVSPSAFAQVSSTNYSSRMATSNTVSPHDAFLCIVGSQSSKAGGLLLGRGSLKCTTPTFYTLGEVWVKAQYCVPVLWGCFFESTGTVIAHRLVGPNEFQYNVLYQAPTQGDYASLRVDRTGEWRIQTEACVSDEDEASQTFCQNVNSSSQIF